MTRRWFATFLAFSIFASACAVADPDLPGTPFANPQIRRPGDYWLTRNSLELYHEHLFDDHELYLWAYPSTLQADPKIWAPRFAYRWQDRIWLDVGTQRSEADPFVSPLVIQGAQLDWDFESYRLTLGGGRTTQEFLPRALVGQPEFHMNQVSLSRRLGDYGVARLSTSGWHPTEQDLGILPGYRSPEASRIISAEVVPDLSQQLRGLSLAGGYGWEMVDVEDSLPSDRRAYNWRFGWGVPGLRLDARQRSQGRAYGPNHFENFLRGQDQLIANLTLEPLPGLTLRETYSNFEFAQPLEGRNRRTTKSETFTHELFAQPGSDLSLGVLLARSLNAQSTTTEVIDVRRWQARADWAAQDRLELSLIYAGVESRGSEGLNTTTKRADLQAGWQLSPRDRVRFLIGDSEVAGLGIRNQGLDLGFGWTHQLPEDLGQFQVDYRRSRFGFSDRSYQSYQFSGQFQPDPRWNLNASAAVYDTGLDRQLSSSLRLTYLLDEHRDLSLYYEQRPFLLFPDVPGLNLGQTSVGLRLRQSFDGPLQNRFEERLEPRVRVTLEGTMPSDQRGRFPIEGARLRVDNR